MTSIQGDELHARKARLMAKFDELPEELRRFVDQYGIDDEGLERIYHRLWAGVDPQWIMLTEKQKFLLEKHVSASQQYGSHYPELGRIATGEIYAR